MMRTIRLYGALADEFGPHFRMDVRSLAEAVHAIGSQIAGFRQAIEAGRFRVTCGPSRRKGLRLDKDLITFGLPAGDLHVVPVVRGAKSGTGAGVGKIIVGALITATAFATGQTWAVSFGLGIALSGVSTLLTPKKKAEIQRKSYMFDGAENTSDQGGGVPLVIGTCMVSGITVSAGVSTAYGLGLPNTGASTPTIRV